MKRKMKKFFSLLTLVLLVMSLVACKESNDNNEDNKPSKDDKVEEVVNVKKDILNEKQETVYAILNKNGTKQKVYVSDLIINNQLDDEIIDMSNLTNIKNVNGTEKCSYTQNSLIWNANKKNINYIGESNQELPVSVSIKYYLDGIETEYEDLVNKKGHITIKFDYTCNQSKVYTINNKPVTIYVPYLVISGMCFNNKTVGNIEGTNVKVVNDGSKSFILTYAFPGLSENLNIENLELPSSAEISFDTTSFNLDTTFSLVSNSILNAIDVNAINDSKNELDVKIEELKTQLMKVLEGTNKLYLGTEALLEGINTLSLKIKEMALGIEELSKNSQALRDGATQVFLQLLDNVHNEFSNNNITLDTLTIENYETVLKTLLTSPTDIQKEELINIASNTLDLKLKDVPTEYRDTFKVLLFDNIQNGKTMEEAIQIATTTLTNASIVNTIKSNESITPDETVYNALTSQGLDSTTAGLIAKLCTYLKLQNGGEAVNYIETSKVMLTDAQTFALASADENKETKIQTLCLNLALNDLKDKVNEAVTKLNSYKEFYEGLNTYTGSIDYMASQIKDQELVAKLQELVSGATEINNGTKELDEKLNSFYNEVIKEILDNYDNNSNELFLRLKYTMELVVNYQMFTYLPNGMTGKTTYIYTTK